MYIFIRFIATSEQGRIFACPASPTNKNGCKSTAVIRRISPLCKKNDEIFHQLRIGFCIILKICLLASENFTVKPVYPGYLGESDRDYRGYFGEIYRHISGSFSGMADTGRGRNRTAERTRRGSGRPAGNGPSRDRSQRRNHRIAKKQD